MKLKIGIFLLILLSLSLLAGSFYLDKLAEKNQMKKYIYWALVRKMDDVVSPNDRRRDNMISDEMYLLTKSIDIPLDHLYMFGASDTLDISSRENSFQRSTAIVNSIISNHDEEYLIKAIANSFFNNGKYYLLHNTYNLSNVENKTRENTDFIKIIAFSGYLNKFRNADALRAFFKERKSLLYNTVDQELYKKHLEEPIKNLFSARKKLKEATNREQFLEEIYAELDSRDSQKYTFEELWALTFWNRRDLEQNNDAVYYILKEIKNHYEEEK